ncbi:MAG TPA: EpsD family peptidyl-prolyl cis-trans isomerase [Burkholderiaceae bacterium]
MKTNFSLSAQAEQNKSRTKFRHGVAHAAIFASLLAALGLAACSHSDGESKPGQALVRVNGDEVTVYQLNEELRQAGNADADPATQRKQLVSALVDRQLLVDEARKQKLDRDPNVVEAIERAKSQILAQAYLKTKVADLPKPDKAEIDAYYSAHPEFFAQRKLFEMRQFVVASKDFSNELKGVMDNAKSLDEVAAWLDAHKIDYAKSQAMRTSQDLPPQILSKMQGPEKTEMFLLHNDSKTLLMSVTAVKDMPVGAEAAAPEIAQFLANKHGQEAADAELKRLHSTAKIEYLNPDIAGAVEDKPAAARDTNMAAAPADAAATATTAATAAAAGTTQAKAEVDPHSIK